jgi:hypothetical protein
MLKKRDGTAKAVGGTGLVKRDTGERCCQM